MTADPTQRLTALDHAHAWHPFTPMRQWREKDPLIIASAQGDHLIDTQGNRYIDGVSSLWCNVHGHRVPELDRAIRDQLDRVAHTTMLGMANIPATELAAQLCKRAPGALNKVFYSDAGATATELAFKMAVGYWFHQGQQRDTLIAIEGAYHGDTVGSMSVGYSATFHKPFDPLVFKVVHAAAPDVFHADDYQPVTESGRRLWALENTDHAERVRDRALADLDTKLTDSAGRIAAVIVEPIVQGAAGIITQPPGYLAGAADLCKKHDTLLIADEVATGFGRTGALFACELEGVTPDILCLGKGITGGYLPLAATLATDTIEQAFTGELHEHRTLYHGHTYTGNPLAAAAALASLDLFDQNDLLNATQRKAEWVAEQLDALRDGDRFPFVADVRQRGLMIGIELVPPGQAGATGFDPSRRLGYDIADACRARGVIVRPLGNVVVLMPPLAIEENNLKQLVDTVVSEIERLGKT